MILYPMGTRGSISACRQDTRKYGGNTTCWHIESSRVSDSSLIVIDAGTGFYELGNRMVGNGRFKTIRFLNLIFTHYHNDHVNGMSMTSLMFMNHIKKRLFGPVCLDQANEKFGPHDALRQEFSLPRFPVTREQLAEAIETSQAGPELTQDIVLCFSGDHVTVIPHSEYRNLVTGKTQQVKINGKMVDMQHILFMRSNDCAHPQKTLMYRFEEYKSDHTLQSAFVLMTDQEAQPEVPKQIINFVRDSAFLAIDCQYSMREYSDPFMPKAGFGHGNPLWVAKMAKATDVPKIGIIHHDPSHSDEAVDAVCGEAKQAAQKLGVDLRSTKISPVGDFQEIEI